MVCWQGQIDNKVVRIRLYTQGNWQHNNENVLKNTWQCYKNSYNKQTEDYYLYYYTRLDLQFNISITKPNAEIYDYYNNRYYYFESTYSTTQKTYIGKKTTIIEINYSYLANNKSNFITVQKSKTVTTNYGYPDEFLFYPCVFNIDMGNISFPSFENLPNLSRFFDETIVPGVIKYHIVAEDNTETQIDKMTYDDIIKNGLKVMDTAACALCKQNSIPIVVFDFKKEDGIKNILDGKEIGTYIS